MCLPLDTLTYHKHKRNVMYPFHITSEQLGDMHVCVFAVCIQFQGGVWTLNMVVCDGLMTMDVMLCTASIFNLCAISVDRSVLFHT